MWFGSWNTDEYWWVLEYLELLMDIGPDLIWQNTLSIASSLQLFLHCCSRGSLAAWWWRNQDLSWSPATSKNVVAPEWVRRRENRACAHRHSQGQILASSCIIQLVDLSPCCHMPSNSDSPTWNGFRPACASWVYNQLLLWKSVSTKTPPVFEPGAWSRRHSWASHRPVSDCMVWSTKRNVAASFAS